MALMSTFDVHSLNMGYYYINDNTVLHNELQHGSF